MTNYPIDNALEASENAFEIDLLNKATGAEYPRAPVCGGNTMAQIMEEYAEEIGINPKSGKFHFTNKRTGESTSDSETTVDELGLIENDVLACTDDGFVAADDEIFEIDLLNTATGAECPRAPVCGGNTLGQITEE